MQESQNHLSMKICFYFLSMKGTSRLNNEMDDRKTKDPMFHGSLFNEEILPFPHSLGHAMFPVSLLYIGIKWGKIFILFVLGNP